MPIRTYSSGMQMRLAFSIAIHTSPEVLLIDEILAVGDERFQQKCMERMLQFRKEGKTILFVSHNAATNERLCDRACVLMHGAMVELGEISKVLEIYRAGVTA